MTAMKIAEQSSRLIPRAAGPLVIVGGAPEIDAEVLGWLFGRSGVTAALRRNQSPRVLVMDLRGGAVVDLAILRSDPAYSSLPLLLLSSVEIPEAVFEILRADDGVVLVERRGWGHLKRRLALLLEVAPWPVGGLEGAGPGRGFSCAGSDSPREVAGLRSESSRPAKPESRRAPAAVRAMHRRPSQHSTSTARAEIRILRRAIDERRRFEHAVLDGVDVGIITADGRGTVTFVNRFARGLLRTNSEALGSDVSQLLGLPSSPDQLLEASHRRGISYSLVRDEVDFAIELSVSRAEPRDARAGYFFIFRDVREEQQRAAERQRFERLAAMGTMVAGFAHEVRNPVAAMRSIAEELAEELRDAGVDMPHVALMLQMLERIERLVKTSLQFGRPAAPKPAYHRPSSIVSSALAELRPRLRDGAVRLELDADRDLPEIHVDERQLTQALVILLHNAIDATGSPARVVVRVREGRWDDRTTDGTIGSQPSALAVRFEVIDDGPGISADILSQIFDPFFTTKSSGTGLGLSIAQQFVHDNGARLEVASTPGSATSFCILVPTST